MSIVAFACLAPVVILAVVFIVRRLIEGTEPPSAWAPVAYQEDRVLSVVELFRHRGEPRRFMCQTVAPDVSPFEVATDTRLPLVGLYDINGPGLVTNKVITPTDHRCVWNVTVEYA